MNEGIAMDPIMQVYAIENGFLLEFKTDPGDIVTLIYAKDEKDVADQIIAQRARVVLNNPRTKRQGEMFTEKEMGSERVL